MHTLFCYYCLFYPISILLYTLNSPMYFVLFRNEDDTSCRNMFLNLRSVLHFLKFYERTAISANTSLLLA